MAFIIFRKETQNGKAIYIHNNQNYQLAGYGLIYSLWIKKGKPLNQGWSISADEILSEFIASYSDKTHSLVIDFHPSSDYRIGLIEIEHIHLYTFGWEEKATWSPMMLELRDVFYSEDYEGLTAPQRRKEMDIIEIEPNRQRIIEFLYLNGEERSWNWGRNGMTNAAFLHDESRNYFRKYF
jgi:hypothetical protein